MQTSILRSDRRKLAAEFYGDPSLAFVGDPIRMTQCRLNTSSTLAPSDENTPSNRPINITKDALLVLENYPISRNKAKSPPSRLFVTEVDYFAPSSLPVNFMPKRPRQEINSDRDNYEPMNSDILSISFKNAASRVARPSRQSAIQPPTQTTSSSEVPIPTNTDDISEVKQASYFKHSTKGAAFSSRAAFRKQRMYEPLSGRKPHPSVTQKASDKSGKIKETSICIEARVLQTFAELQQDIQFYIESTDSYYPRSTVERNTLTTMLGELESRKCAFIEFLKRKYQDDYSDYFQVLNSGSDTGKLDSRFTDSSLQITSHTEDGLSEQYVKMQQHSCSILSMVLKTQRSIRKKLQAMKVSFDQHTNSVFDPQINAASALRDSMTIQPIYPWIHTSSSHFHTNSRSNNQVDTSEIGAVPINKDEHDSQLENSSDMGIECDKQPIATHIPTPLTLSTSTVPLTQSDEAFPREHGIHQKESHDYDGPALALAFSKELDLLSQEHIQAQASGSTKLDLSDDQLINARDTFLKSNAPTFKILEENSIYTDYYIRLKKFKQEPSPNLMTAPVNSQMHQDLRNTSSPDCIEAPHSQSVQRMNTGKATRAPRSARSSKVIAPGNTIGGIELEKNKHPSVNSTTQPREIQSARAVDDFDVLVPLKTPSRKAFPRVPTSSPRKVNLELIVDTEDPQNSPLKFEFLSKLKTHINDKTYQRTKDFAQYIEKSALKFKGLSGETSKFCRSDTNKSIFQINQPLQDDPSKVPTDRALLDEIRKYVTKDIANVYSNFINSLQAELAKKLGTIEKDIQGKVKNLVNQRKTEYEKVRLSIIEGKDDIMERISSLQEAIKVRLTAHKMGTKGIEKKVQLSLARNGIHERLPQISPAITESLKKGYCDLSRSIGNWITTGYEQCTAITCQGTAGNGIRYVLFPCGDSICSSCQLTNKSVCPICLHPYEFSVQAQDGYVFNGPPEMLPTRVITDSCAQLRDLLILVMGIEDIEVLGYEDAEKKFATKDSMGTWQAYSRKLEPQGLVGKYNKGSNK